MPGASGREQSVTVPEPRHELADQFLHADLTGTLGIELALVLADVALSYCRGHLPDPPADFTPRPRYYPGDDDPDWNGDNDDDPDPYSAVPDR